MPTDSRGMDAILEPGLDCRFEVVRQHHGFGFVGWHSLHLFGHLYLFPNQSLCRNRPIQLVR